MSITLKVPSIACDVCAETITKAIKNDEPSANVKIDVANKIVTVETEASETKIKDAIISAGHTIG
jgi:copper chaperone